MTSFCQLPVKRKRSPYYMWSSKLESGAIQKIKLPTDAYSVKIFFSRARFSQIRQSSIFQTSG